MWVIAYVHGQTDSILPVQWDQDLRMTNSVHLQQSYSPFLKCKFYIFNGCACSQGLLRCFSFFIFVLERNNFVIGRESNFLLFLMLTQILRWNLLKSVNESGKDAFHFHCSNAVPLMFHWGWNLLRVQKLLAARWNTSTWTSSEQSCAEVA